LFLSFWAYWDRKQGYIIGYFILPSLLILLPLAMIDILTLPFFIATYILLYVLTKVGTLGSADRIALSLIASTLIILHPIALIPFPVVLGITVLYARSQTIRFLPNLYWAYLSSVFLQVLIYSIGL